VGWVWNWPVTSLYCWGKECVDLYLQSSPPRPSSCDVSSVKSTVPYTSTWLPSTPLKWHSTVLRILVFWDVALLHWVFSQVLVDCSAFQALGTTNPGHSVRSHPVLFYSGADHPLLLPGINGAIWPTAATCSDVLLLPRQSKTEGCMVIQPHPDISCKFPKNC
jgi:hypothetical protein